MGDATTILQAISTVGFPIVCVIAMAWYVKKQTDDNRIEMSKLNETHHAEIKEMNDLHKQETKEFIQAIDNNTLALTVLTDHLKEGTQNG